MTEAALLPQVVELGKYSQTSLTHVECLRMRNWASY